MGELRTDELRVDSHKLMYHVERVSDWLKGKDVFPIYMDVSPTSLCNHHCIFCGLDYAHDDKVFLSKDVLKGMVKGASRCGVKSIMYAGEGEPLLHKDISDVIAYTKKNGIDVAVTTNGVVMDMKFLKENLKHLTWIRISIDAGSARTYARIHRCREDDFRKVMKNIEDAVRLKKRNSYGTTIGTQFILLKENMKEAGLLAKRLKDIGADYIIIKPYSKHPLSINDAGTDIDYTKMIHIQKDVERHSAEDFKVIFRRNTMEKRLKEKPYKRCYGAPFWVYISAKGDIYSCSSFLGIERFSFGNLNRESFSSIMAGKRRKDIIRYIYNKMEARKCREFCRLDEINLYLWQLKHPHPHVNFI